MNIRWCTDKIAIPTSSFLLHTSPSTMPDFIPVCKTSDIPDPGKDVFEVDGEFDSEMVKEGNAIPMMDGEGNRLNGVVVEVGADIVKMDFNHPLAGDDLFFSGTIVEIREATAEELEHGHIHGEKAGGCGEGCGDGEGGGCGSQGCGCGH